MVSRPKRYKRKLHTIESQHGIVLLICILFYFADVVCSDSYMTVYLDSSIGRPTTVHFLDPTCTVASGYVYRKGIQWMYLYTRYDQCQTSMAVTYNQNIILFYTFFDFLCNQLIIFQSHPSD